MRIFGLNRRIIRVLLGAQYAHMLEYRAEIALWALSGVLPFIMLSVWSGSDARSGPVSYTHLTLPTICSV